MKESDYRLVTTLEAEGSGQVFRLMNVVDGTEELPLKLKVRSLSVGDVVVDSAGRAPFCARCG